MRLLDTHTLEIHEFPGDSDKDYAILSHRWGKEECTLQHMSTPGVESRKGYAKIQFCCKQAVKDGLDWAWVDTCCIDKTSTAELSEAINSMFRWYQNAKICYAFLDDVGCVKELAESLWFTRGWTLQELIAPHKLSFYSSTWDYLGSKAKLAAQLHAVTGIEEYVLSTGTFSHICIAGRMRWAARRTTTRVEDLAYCLMGIFDVNMPLIYGEGRKAFLRLQQEIMKIHSDDQTIFAWGLPDNIQRTLKKPPSEQAELRGLFAAAPSDFATSHDIRQLVSREPVPLPVNQHSGLRVQFPFLQMKWYRVLVLNCTVYVHYEGSTAYIGIPIRNWESPYWARYESLCLVPVRLTEFFSTESTIVREPTPFMIDRRPTSFRLVRLYEKGVVTFEENFVIDEIYCLPYANYSPTEQRISFALGHPGPHGVIFFSPKHLDTGSSKKSNYNRPFPFAIVLGQRRDPEYAFVPLLTPESPDEDFHRIFRTDKRLISHCMTKKQLKKALKETQGWDFPWRPSPSAHGQPLDFWMTRERLESRLHIAIHVGSLDLMENTAYVFLQLSSCKSRDTSKFPDEKYLTRQEALQDFNDRVKDRIRSWWIREVRWFEERE